MAEVCDGAPRPIQGGHSGEDKKKKDSKEWWRQSPDEEVKMEADG